MSAPLRLLALLAALLLGLAAGGPGQAVAQGAGDEQYQDPLAGEQAPSSGGEDPAPPAEEPVEPSGGDTSTDSDPAPAPSAEPAPVEEEVPPVPEPAGVEAQSGAAPSAQESGQLPRTGGDAVLPGTLGAVLLAAGLALRVGLRRPDGLR